MIVVNISAIIKIHTVILNSTGKIPFVCEKKQCIFSLTITQRRKNWRQTYEKRDNMERDEVLSEPKYSNRNHTSKKLKTTSIIVSKITVLYFQSKVVPIICKIVA